jgi:hypothetical protein
MITLIPSPLTRINDQFIDTDDIDATPISRDIVHPIIEGEPNRASFQFQSNFYKKIGLDVVTETVFDYPYPCITEKTLRPIGSKRMFIVVGAHGILSMLKSKGFKTFDDIIDESYDSIIDPCKRFRAVVDAVESFISLDLEKIRQYYIDNQQKFEHNFQTLKNLRSTELISICSRLGISLTNVYNNNI